MLGNILKKLRKEKQLTQKELAEKINVTHVSISGYESGKRNPDTETLQVLANYFGTSVDYLLGRTQIRNYTLLNDDEEFKAFANDPELQQWYKELPTNSEEDLRRLRKMWDIIKDTEK